MKNKVKVDELVIDGTTYVPKDSIQIVEYTGDIKIVILQRGWIYIGIFERSENNICKLHKAYNIRSWGTTKGLGELVHGPTNNTKLDKCEGIVEFDWLTVIHTITVNKEKWNL
jgi:hypothetical protein